MSEPGDHTKPVQTGLVDMGEINFYDEPSNDTPTFSISDLANYPGAFGEIVLNVTWADVQPSATGPLQTAAIDTAIAEVQAYNAANDTDVGIKLRVWGGNTAPDWAKAIDGPPITITGPGAIVKNEDAPQTIGRFWTSDYIDAWTSFQTALANTAYNGMTYENNPIIRGISNTAGAYATDEPFVPLQPAQVAELQSGGYTDAAQELTLRTAVSDYAAWSGTPLDYTMNLFHPEDGGQETGDENFTLAVLQEAENAGRAVQVGNHALDNPLYEPDAFVYAQLAEDAALDPATVPGSYQTASPSLLTANAGSGSAPSWGAYADWPSAVSQGVAADAGDIELWDYPGNTGFTGLAPSQVQDLATLLAAGTPPMPGEPDDGATIGFVAPASVTGPSGTIVLSGVDAVLLESARVATSFTATLSSTGGDALSVNDASGIVSGSATGSLLHLSGTLAQVNTALAGLTDTISAGTDIVQVSVSDNLGDSAVRRVGVVASASPAAAAPLEGSAAPGSAPTAQSDGGDLDIADAPGSEATVILGAPGATLDVAGNLNLGDGSTLLAMLAPSAYSTASLTIGGALELASGGTARITGALNAGRFDEAAGGLLAADGTLTTTGSGPIINDGTIEAVSDQTLGLQQLTLAEPVAGTGTLLIDPGASLILAGASGPGESVSFAPASVSQLSNDPYSPSTLELETPFGMKSTIGGLSLSDSLVLDGVTATGASYDATDGTLTVMSQEGTLSYALSGDLAGLLPAVSPVGSDAGAQSTITFVAPSTGAPPTVRAPTTLAGAADTAVLVPGIVLSVPLPASTPADTTITVTLAAKTGTLSAGNDDNQVTVEHVLNIRTLSLTGTLAAVETSLQSLTYQAVAGKASDAITVSVSDYAGAAATPATIVVLNSSTPVAFAWAASGGGGFADAADWTTGAAAAATAPGGADLAAFGPGAYTVSGDAAVGEIAVTGAPTLTGQVTAQGEDGVAVNVDGGGTLTLGGGGVLTAEQAAIVGCTGAGGLTLMGGALALTGAGAAGALTIGEGGGSTGTVVDLEQIQATGTVTVGEAGRGTLTLLGLAASLSDDGATLGALAAGQGTAVVNGGMWTNAGALTVGDAGSGTLTIDGTAGGVSGQVVADDATIGAEAGGAGTVTVAGGDLLIADADAPASTLALGDSGTGSLTIGDGGVVTVGEAAGNEGDNTGELIVGTSGSAEIGGDGALEVDGSATVDGSVTVSRTPDETALFAMALTLSVGNGGLINLGGGNATLRATAIDIAAGAMLSGTGTISGEGGGGNTVLLAGITNEGSIAAAGGSLLVYGDVVGSGQLSVATGATITLQAGVTAGQTLAFSPHAEAVLDDPGAFSGTIAGFAAGDTLDLASTAATGASFSAGVLTIETGTGSLSLHVAGSYAADDFSVQADGLGGTLVTLATGSGEGDVHLVTFGGVHYDFQAVGAFVAARSTMSGNPFQVQIETAAANGATSVTTAFAAALSGTRVTFAVGRADPVWIDGAIDSVLQPGVEQSLAGGTLVQLSPDSYRLAWAGGESATLTDEGSFFNWSVSLGSDDGGASVQGLLGDVGDTASGDASSSQATGALAQTWSVTPGTSLFDTTWGGLTAPPPRPAAADNAPSSQAGQRFLSADDGLDTAGSANPPPAASPYPAGLQHALALDPHDVLASFIPPELRGLVQAGKLGEGGGMTRQDDGPVLHASAAMAGWGAGSTGLGFIGGPFYGAGDVPAHHLTNR